MQVHHSTRHRRDATPGRGSGPYQSSEPTGRALDLMLARIHRGQRHRGVAQGPDALMHHGLTDRLSASGNRMRTTRVVEEEPGGESPARVYQDGTALSQLADRIEESLVSGGFPLTVGGDHSIAFASVEGVLRAAPDARVLYIDAHADLNTPETSPSGNSHGMPLAAQLGLYEPTLLGASHFVAGRLRPHQIAFVGLRDVDPGEKAFMERYGIVHYSAAEAQAMGLEACIGAALGAIDPQGIHPVHVSFDIDVVDPDLAPATGVPVADGLSADDVQAISRALQQVDRLCALDLVEINPDLAPDQAALTRTLDVALDFLATSLSVPARQASTA